jgi:hypothetical protein
VSQPCTRSVKSVSRTDVFDLLFRTDEPYELQAPSVSYPTVHYVDAVGLKVEFCFLPQVSLECLLSELLRADVVQLYPSGSQDW